MIQALNELFDLVFLIAFVSEVQELFVLLQILELGLEHLQKELVKGPK